MPLSLIFHSKDNKVRTGIYMIRVDCHKLLVNRPVTAGSAGGLVFLTNLAYSVIIDSLDSGISFIMHGPYAIVIDD